MSASGRALPQWARDASLGIFVTDEPGATVRVRAGGDVEVVPLPE